MNWFRRVRSQFRSLLRKEKLDHEMDQELQSHLEMQTQDAERNHQGKDNVILFPLPADRVGEAIGQIQSRERLGGLLKFYYREAA